MHINLPVNQQVVFVSDVHLGFGGKEADKQREKLFLTMLQQERVTAAHVFIVGDLFDYWFDYRNVIPRSHVRTLALLAEMVEGGLPITYLMGNHDFGHYTYFRDELGIDVDLGDISVEINSTKLYVAHGDGKVKNDTGYLVLRSVLRNKLAQIMYRWLHPTVGIGLAARTSHGSREYTRDKEYGQSDGLEEFAEQKIAEGYHYVVMGHRHRMCDVQIGNGRYINLGHWLHTQPTYGVFTQNQGFQMKRIVL